MRKAAGAADEMVKRVFTNLGTRTIHGRMAVATVHSHPQPPPRIASPADISLKISRAQSLYCRTACGRGKVVLYELVEKGNEEVVVPARNSWRSFRLCVPRKTTQLPPPNDTPRTCSPIEQAQALEASVNERMNHLFATGKHSTFDALNSNTKSQAKVAKSSE